AGQRQRREEMVQAIRYVVQAVSVPVTADVEGGYGDGSPRDVVESVRAVIAAGASGINLEDSPGANGQVLMPPEAHAERIRAAQDAARADGGDLVINARTDVFLFQVGEPASRFDETVRRARAPPAAGRACGVGPGRVRRAPRPR